MKIPRVSALIRNSNNSVIISGASYNLRQKHSVIKYAIYQEYERIHNLINWLKSRTKRDYLLASSAVLSIGFIVLLGLTATFLAPKNHTYSFSNDNCFFNPVALPEIVRPTGSEDYITKIYPSISIGNTPLFSANTCLEIATIPEPDSSDVIKLKTPLAVHKNIALKTKPLPEIKAIDELNKPISPNAILLFNSNQTDTTFDYKLKISDKTTDCNINYKLINCSLLGHSLDQGQSYTYELIRVLGDKSSIVISSSITTLDPVVIIDGNIKQDEVVYSAISEITFSTNKPIKSLGDLSLSSEDGEEIFSVKATFSEESISVSVVDTLPRNTTFRLTLESMQSTDGASLSEPYILTFRTSTGPRVQSVNISSYNVSPSASIILTFDIELDANQPIENTVLINNASGAIPSITTVNSNTVTIRPVSNLPFCGSFTVSVTNSLKNKHGISGNSEWSMDSRTACKQAFSIGNSVQGRSITAYKFGSGATKILIVGGMHGNEKSSVYTLNSFVDDLERNFFDIPSNKTVIVIPNSNPDGFLASSRTNINNVDLNRNFPTFDWTSGVYMPGNVFLETGGGNVPLSEPESSALANYTSSISPRVTLTFHATGRAVFANDAGDSKAIADVYSEKSGFTSFNSADSDTFFSYPTTGEYEDWVRDGLNLPALLVELAGVSNNEFRTQRPALWAMLSL